MANIIVVDDSKISRKMLSTILLENGHKVIGEASNGEEGYEMYVKHMPDLITLDITMPVLDGLECLKKIRSEFPKAKAVMVTSLGSDRKRNEAMEAGAIGYIVKPFDPEEVEETIGRCVKAKIRHM